MKIHDVVSLLVVLANFILPVAHAAESADAFPSQTVKIVVPYIPGGISDLLGRALASRLEQKWGKSVVVENKPGASEAVGASYVAKSKPDGYTLLLPVMRLFSEWIVA